MGGAYFHFPECLQGLFKDGFYIYAVYEDQTAM